jgi:hypothetical protein
MAVTLIAVVAVAVAPEAPGRRVDLGGATLFVPEGYRPDGGVVHVVLHLHGAPSVVEPALVATGWPAVLVTFNRKGLSRVYAEPFADRTLFPGLLDATLKRVKELGLAEAPRLGRVVVSSFSAGFGGVRELLKDPAHLAQIHALVMADSLYAGYEGDPALRRVDPRLMDGFRRFALAAAEGKKTFLLTHSAQVPQGYASTTETADFLIVAVGARAEPVSRDWGDGWTQTRRASRGNFTVLGFSGGEGTDHMKHLRGIAKLWKALSDPFSRTRLAPSATSSGRDEQGGRGGKVSRFRSGGVAGTP